MWLFQYQQGDTKWRNIESMGKEKVYRLVSPNFIFSASIWTVSLFLFLYALLCLMLLFVSLSLSPLVHLLLLSSVLLTLTITVTLEGVVLLFPPLLFCFIEIFKSPSFVVFTSFKLYYILHFETRWRNQAFHPCSLEGIHTYMFSQKKQKGDR